MVDRPSAQVPDLHGAPKRRRELPYRVVGFLRFAREDRHHVLASRRPRRKVVNRIRRAAERTALRELPSLPVVHPPLVLVTFGTRHSSPLHRSQVRPGVHQRRPFSRAQNQAPSFPRSQSSTTSTPNTSRKASTNAATVGMSSRRLRCIAEGYRTSGATAWPH